MIDLLRKYTASFLDLPGQVAWQVQSVLSKIALCRTAKLLGRLFECRGCQQRYGVYNSCGERHCPQCSGARRADWTDRSEPLLLLGVNYFQVIFTIPDKISRIVLGNRRQLYRLLFRSAWSALKHEMSKQNIDPAALLVLHTWNQELGHHPHIHALVPGGGPSANTDNESCWVTARDWTRPWRTEKPSLVDNVTLSQRFRDTFVRGLGWLVRHNKLKLTDEWQQLSDAKVLRRWLKSLRASAWNVFIEGPPHGKSDPKHVLKYLTRYMTGGPIGDNRIESDEAGMVTFTARSKSKQQRKNSSNANRSSKSSKNNRVSAKSKVTSEPPRRIKIPGDEFVRRWSLHVLPKGFTRSRCYGGFHGSRRKAYLQACRKLLSATAVDDVTVEDSVKSDPSDDSPTAQPKCPRCQIEMDCIADLTRPSWKNLLGPNHAHPRKPCGRVVASPWHQVPQRDLPVSDLPAPET